MPITYGNLIAAYIALDQIGKARAVADEMVQRYPDVGFTYRSLGQLLIAEQRLDEAIATLTKARQIDARDPFALGLRAIAEALAGRWEPFERTIASLIADGDPTFKWAGSAMKHKGALMRGRSAEALVAADEAVRAYANPGQRSAESHLFAAETRLARAEPREALREAEDARRDVAKQIFEMDVLVAIAGVQARLGRNAEANRAAEALETRVTPLFGGRDRAYAHYARGQIALHNRDAATAIRELTQAQAHLPPRTMPSLPSLHLPLWFALGEAHLAAGNDAEALRAFQRASESTFDHVTSPIEFTRSFYFLGTLHEKRGDTAAAREAYRRFVNYWKDGDLDRDRIAEATRKSQ